MNKKSSTYHLIISMLVLLLTVGCSVAQKNKEQNTPDTKVLSSKEVEVIDYYYRATTQRLLGNNNDALTLYLYCINKDPKNSGAFYQLSCIYNELEQPTKGVEFAKQAVKLDPNNKWYLIEYADLLVQTGKIKDASKVYDQILKIDPNNQDYQLQKADILIYLKQYSKAIEIYNKLEKKLGVVAEISLQKQKLFLAQGNYNAAEKEMQTLIDKYPNESEYYGMFAEFYLSINKKEKAMQMFQKVLELDPQNPIIHLALANFYQETGDTEKAFEYIKLAFKNPEVPIDNKIKIMLSYYDLSEKNSTRKTEAEELLKILLEVHPEEAKAWSIYGDFLLRDNKTEEAIVAFEKVIDLQKDRHVVYERLMDLYFEKGDYDQLEKKSTEAIELFPNMPLFYFCNGKANFVLSKYEAALESFVTGKDLVINAPKMKADFYTGIAEVYMYQNKNNDAKSNYETAISLNADNLYFLASYAYYLCTVENNYIKANELVNQALKINSKDYITLDVQAWILYKSNDIEGAYASIQNALMNGGDKDARVLEHYGDILYKKTNITEAVEQWKKAQKATGKKTEYLNSKIEQQKLIE